MMLYATTLMIGNVAVPYQVYKEGDRLFFKPSVVLKDLPAPIFWVTGHEGAWQPVNIQDEHFKNAILADIVQHDTELRKAI